ncbi:translocation/assembly module TamB domain-containing protein [Falsihalocynthiibacter sp. SS001]|uniref:translocation/assembly module TamB domain-containing protein n=1 Tax=Falsihalocynthiibacter sp. SS001 TaxID=3349698 RepID=UPI0036D21168
MRHYILVGAVCLGLTTPAFSQDEDEGGFLSNKIEETLSAEGRTVKISGFRGALSSTATMAKLTVADSEGIWLSIEDASLNWQRAALLRGRFEVKELTAARIEVLRKPIAPPSEAPTPEASGFALPELPVSINIDNVSSPEVVLGDDILGMPLALSLVASASLEDGSGHAKVIALRTDGEIGTFALDTTYTSESQSLNVDFDFQEDKDGIVATLAKIPNAPALEASITGQGDLSDFQADFFLASDGVNRIEGTGRLYQEVFEDGQDDASGGAEPVEVSQHFVLDLGGDVTALLAPDYHDFFGPDLKVKLDGYLEPSGALDIEEFALNAKTLDLAGRVRLTADSWPVLIDVAGEIKSADGTPVLLPIPGAETFVDDVNLKLTYDAHKGDRWQGNLDIVGFEQGDIEIDAARLGVAGQFESEGTSVRAVDANISFNTKGLTLNDPDLDTALGSELKGRARVEYRPLQPLIVSGVNLNALGATLTGDLSIGALADGLPTEIQANLLADDIARFSRLAGRPISGLANVSLTGDVAPLAGTFDLKVQGETNDLTVGIEQVDALIAGQGTLFIDAMRDSEGAALRQFNLSTPEVTASADATVSSDAIAFNYDANLRDVGVILPAYPGPLAMRGNGTQTEEGLQVSANLEGPLGTTANVDGLVSGEDVKLDVAAHLDNFGAIVSELPGSADLAGTVERQGTDWLVDGTLEGSMGISAAFNGKVDENTELDMAVNGRAPLAVANPFIEPQTIRGNAEFDLAINGPPALDAVSGQVNISSGEFNTPSLEAGLRDIAGNINLSSSFANIDINAQVSSGGTIGVQGGVSLVSDFNGNLEVLIQSVRLERADLFSTVVNGDITVDGPLKGGATISGDINIGETLVSVPSGGVASVTDIPPMDHIGASPAVQVTLERAGLAQSVQEATQRANAGPEYPLNIRVSAPDRIFIRGRGIDAELGGELTITGTIKNIVSIGAFELRRGRILVLEKRFELSDGEIRFEGNLDPRLSLIATTPIPQGSAAIEVGGQLSDPEITFTSTPAAPEDEVLALIFFGESIEDISGFQALQLASAIATLAGKGSGVLSDLRNAIPVDDLEIDSDEDGNATLRVGKRISDNVYSDIAVNSEGETEISLNLDLTSKFTVKGTTTDDGNSSIGIFFDTNY